MANNYDYLGNIRGPIGYSVENAEIIANGHLLVTRTDGTTIDAGVAEGPQGLPGVNAVDNDTAVAGYISTAGTSATKTALDAATSKAYSPLGGNIQATVRKLSDDFADVTILVLGDSTAAQTDKWPYLMMPMLRLLYPHRTLLQYVWNTTTKAYDAPTTIATGTSTHNINFYQGAVSGTVYESVLPNFDAQVAVVQPDLVMIHMGHNYGATAAAGGFPSDTVMDYTFRERATRFVCAVKAAIPDADVFLNSQNPYLTVGASIGTVTIASTTGVLTVSVAHGLLVGDVVQLAGVTGGAPLVSGTTYYVQSVPSTTTLTLAATIGGALIVTTTSGTASGISTAGRRGLSNIRAQVQRDLCADLGCAYGPVLEAFLATGDPASYINSDGLHPNAAGSQLTADTLIEQFQIKPNMAPSARVMSPLLIPTGNFLTNGDMKQFTTPPALTGWTALNTVLSKETTLYESGNGYSVKATGTGSGVPSVYQIIPQLRRYAGKVITFAVRLRVPSTSSSSAGRLAISGDGGFVSTNSGTLTNCYDTWVWVYVTGRVPVGSTFVTASIGVGAVNSTDVTYVDRAVVVLGHLPRDIQP